MGAVFLVLFMRRQHRVEYPLVHLEILHSRQYQVSFWASNFLYASFMGITLIIPLYIENLWGGSAFGGIGAFARNYRSFLYQPSCRHFD